MKLIKLFFVNSYLENLTKGILFTTNKLVYIIAFKQFDHMDFEIFSLKV